MKPEEIARRVKVATVPTVTRRADGGSADFEELRTIAREMAGQATEVLGLPPVRNIASPITDDQLSPLPPKCACVRFDSPLTDEDHGRLSSFLRQYPDARLSMFGHYTEECEDLGFLRHYPFLKRFAVNVRGLKSFAGIEAIASSAESLSLGATASKRISLAFLRKFTRLGTLCLEGHAKDIEALSALTNLERLTLRSITLPGLWLLTDLKKLWWFALKLGGTKNISLLPSIGNIKYFEAWMVRGLSDLNALGELHSLQYLKLQAMKQVTQVPPMQKLTKLRTVYLETMKGLRDLSQLREAVCLENLAVIDGGHMMPEDFRVLVGHPNLKTFSAGLGSDRKNRVVQQMLPLPEANCRLAEFAFE